MPRRRDDRWRPESWDAFAPSRPRAAEGGIRARSARGAFGRSWWAKRWIGWLEGLGLGARLARGRTYARQGQVLEITIEPGEVHARVQGSRATPYRVSIQVPPLGRAEWRQVATAIAAQSAFAARLLAGEIPQDIETAFQAAGVPLFPTGAQDLRTACSCPDWSNPCKHVAAVYYLIGEEIDRDPFLLFRLRGMPRDELFALLTATAAPAAPAQPATEPLPADPVAFWGVGATPFPLPDPAAPPIGLALLRRMGNLPFWRGARDMAEILEPAYARLQQGSAGWLAGEAAWSTAAEAQGEVRPQERVTGAGRPAGKSRDRARLEADLRAGVSAELLRARYDGRILRPILGRRRDG